MAVSRCHVATSADEGMRLDACMGQNGLYASRSAAAKAIEAGRVLVDGKQATKKHVVRTGQAIVYEPDVESVDTPLTGEHIPLDVRYEDDDIIVLSKQAGLVCHPSEDHRDGTLVNALIYRYGAEGLCNVQGDRDRLGIVHRLDMDTTGLMMAAKTDDAGQALMDAIRDHVVDRRYLALVHGVISIETGMVDAPIARHATERTRMAIRDSENARDAITTFRVLRRFEPAARDNGYSLIDCKLFTGRTHQIRVHMEYAKHPLVGDPLYTSGKPRFEAANLGLHRQFLHSFKLSFDHPITGERLEFEDSLPDDLQEVLDSLSDREM
ncbi:MAG TPA: RluA family pseudouridine synthase [Eggerthellaceae bacterium]|nr:RluA family pseudouridine synthase [Eggerthellaceae bacterium]